MSSLGGAKSLFGGSREEYRGWRRFRRATGLWPIWSILASTTSLPSLFAVGSYVLIRTLETHSLPIIYSVLVSVGFSLGLLWYAIRRLANHADMVRAQRLGTRPISGAVERFIR